MDTIDRILALMMIVGIVLIGLGFGLAPTAKPHQSPAFCYDTDITKSAVCSTIKGKDWYA